ncbi:MAG: hypothetical protein OEW75_19140 [Cyclobacteriaceae bacterium]|nr:hypothetical protein [Cyclobacteriaceae bacterium]
MSKNKTEKPKVHKALDGFSIEIDSFGEMKSTIAIDEINKFLNKNVEDKKFQERNDYKKIKEEGKFKKDQEKS